MSADERYKWVMDFEELYGGRLNFADWFGNIRGVLHAFSDLGLVKPGSWYGVSDASTLEAIEAGYDIAHRSAFAPSTINPGARLWSSFFQYRESNPSDTSGSERLWGKAEEAAVHFGAALADFVGAPRPPGVQTFLNVGDAYREALQSQDTSRYR